MFGLIGLLWSCCCSDWSWFILGGNSAEEQRVKANDAATNIH